MSEQAICCGCGTVITGRVWHSAAGLQCDGCAYKVSPAAEIEALRTQLARQAEQIAGLTKERDSLRTRAEALAGACEAPAETGSDHTLLEILTDIESSDDAMENEVRDDHYVVMEIRLGFIRGIRQALAAYRTQPGGPGRGDV